jgi:predicted transposase YbfD/YdcC
MQSTTDLLAHFNELEDPRIDRTKRYPLIEIIFLAICATVSGCEGWKAIRDFGVIKLDWLRKFLPYAEGIPVDDTIARVMRRLDTKQFRDCFVSWMKSVSETTTGDIVAIDGKTLRGSYDSGSGKGAIHMVSAWSTANSLVLGQEKTNEKSNEITAIPELLEVLSLKGCLVSIDAMGCQHAIASKIVEKKANYLLALKGNQGHLHQDVVRFFTEALGSAFKNIAHDFYEECDAGHGRIELRQCWVINPYDQAGCFSGLDKWRSLKKIVMLKTRREMKEQTTEDTRFYITSHAGTARFFMEAVRKHWQVENALHWTLDVTLNEDASRIRVGSSPENYAMIRHIALNIVRSYTKIKASVKRKLTMAALDDNFRFELIKELI